MAGAVAGGIAMVGSGMFVNGTGGALFFDCAAATGAVFVSCIKGWFCSVRTPAESGHGQGADDDYHEKRYVFMKKWRHHMSIGL